MISASNPASRPGQIKRLIQTATVALGVDGAITLAALASTLEDTRRSHASLVFGICLLLCACCSYLYNIVETRWRAFLRFLDHAAIFLLIAGTYTPFVVGIGGPLGFGMLEWVWALALVGIALKLLAGRRGDRLFVLLYLAMGWLFVFSLPSFIALNPLSSLILLLVGGLAYTLGAAIYFRGIGAWTDAVWHGSVFLGSLSHLLAVIVLCLARPAVPGG
jgi:hemolysin III